MRKLLVAIGLGLISSTVFATTGMNSESPNAYSPFQQFDRQFSLGFGVTSGNLTNGNNGAVNNSQYVNLEIERLFNIGVWMDVNASLLTYYSQAADPAVPSLGTTTGSQPNFGGINAKVGYAFPVLGDKLLLTPYGQLGRNTNISSYTMAYSGSTTNLTNDYFWSVGGGARLEYRVNNIFDFYLDQNAIYNASQAPTIQGLAPNNNYAYTSTLGGKFNLYRNFQLGAQAFYTNYYYVNGLTTTNSISALVPQSSVGGLVSVGLTY